MRLLVVESLSLAALGGALGLLVAMWGVDMLPSVLEVRLPRADGIRMDRGVLAFSACATFITGLIFGLAPALQMARSHTPSLKDSGRTVAGTVRGPRRGTGDRHGRSCAGGGRAHWRGVVGAQLCDAQHDQRRFVPRPLLSFNVQFLAIPDAAARGQVANTLIERLSALPGVEAAGASTGFPTVTPQRAARVEVEGRTLTAGKTSCIFIAATPGYFSALQTPILQGRAIESVDRAGSEPIVVINRAVASQLFPGGDAVGHRLRIINPEQSPAWRTIVGVVGDVKYRGLDEATPATVYTPFVQTPFMWLYMMVRTPGTFNALVSTLRTAVPSVDPSLTAANVRPMTDVIAQGISGPRFNMLLVSGFAALALLLSSIGIYGVIAYSVAQRHQEIGVRMALGAGRRDILRLVLGEGIAIALGGVGLGIAGSIAASRVMSGLLVGVSARDPLTFVVGTVILLLVALVASYTPARRRDARRALPRSARLIEIKNGCPPPSGTCGRRPFPGAVAGSLTVRSQCRMPPT